MSYDLKWKEINKEPHWVYWRDGSKDWFNEGRIHCEIGPASYDSSGRKHWAYRGKFVSQKIWFSLVLKDNLNSQLKLES